MKSLLNLSKEDRIQTIFTDLMMKESQMITFSPQYVSIEPTELIDIIQLIENRVYYITDSPSVDYQNHNYTSLTFRLNSIDDFKTIMENHPDEFFILHSIQTNGMVISNTPGISQPKSYNLRGVFITDFSIIREKRIGQILGDE